MDDGLGGWESDGGEGVRRLSFSLKSQRDFDLQPGVATKELGFVAESRCDSANQPTHPAEREAFGLSRLMVGVDAFEALRWKIEVMSASFLEIPTGFRPPAQGCEE